MATRAVQTVVTYRAWDTSANAPKTGDVANHTLRWVKDGTSSSTTNSPSEVDSTNAKGIYKLTLTSTETDCLCGTLCGVSSTANVALFGPEIGFLQIPNAVPGASGGVFIAGSNAATTVNITGNITGNLSGSVGSVTGAVGSVTGNVGGSVASVTGNVGGNVVGSVGSVTGNVGGNVVGSVASVTGAVGSVTGSVGGNVTGSVGSVVGNVGGNVVGSVASVTGNVGGNVTGTVASVVDLSTTTTAESSAVPAATATIKDKINFVATMTRNKITQTATTQLLRNDGDSGTIATSTVSDDGVTAIRGKFA